MFLYIIDTRHFEFKIFAQNDEDAKEKFREAWKIHCEQSDADEEYGEELLEDIEGCKTPVVEGVYRDDTLIYKG